MKRGGMGELRYYSLADMVFQDFFDCGTGSAGLPGTIMALNRFWSLSFHSLALSLTIPKGDNVSKNSHKKMIFKKKIKL